MGQRIDQAFVQKVQTERVIGVDEFAVRFQAPGVRSQDRVRVTLIASAHLFKLYVDNTCSSL
jgi:hypothetical protein